MSQDMVAPPLYSHGRTATAHWQSTMRHLLSTSLRPTLQTMHHYAWLRTLTLPTGSPISILHRQTTLPPIRGIPLTTPTGIPPIRKNCLRLLFLMLPITRTIQSLCTEIPPITEILLTPVIVHQLITETPQTLQRQTLVPPIRTLETQPVALSRDRMASLQCRKRGPSTLLMST